MSDLWRDPGLWHQSAVESPEAWLEYAEGFLRVVEVLNDRLLEELARCFPAGVQSMTKKELEGLRPLVFGLFGSIPLLTGYSIENVAKARLAKLGKLTTATLSKVKKHDLQRFVADAAFVTTHEERMQLKLLSENLRWVSRYPVPLRAEEASAYFNRPVHAQALNHGILIPFARRLFNDVSASLRPPSVA